MRIVSVLLACSFAACSGSPRHELAPSGDAGASSHEPSSSAGGAQGKAGAANMGSAGADSAGGGAASAAGAAGANWSAGGEAPSGGVTGKIGQIVVKWDGTRVSGTALFEGGGPAVSGGTTLCTTTNVGPCHVQVCETDAGPESPMAASAGAVTITGGSEPLVFTPSTMFESLYDLSSGSAATIAAGATLTAQASGADVPAFNGKSVKMPSGIVVSADYASIPYDQDLELAWTGGGADGEVVFAIESLGQTAIGSLSCEFTPGAHGGTVPKAALGLLPSCAANEGPICDWTLEPRSTTSFEAGKYAIDFSARAAGKTGEFSN